MTTLRPVIGVLAIAAAAFALGLWLRPAHTKIVTVTNTVEQTVGIFHCGPGADMLVTLGPKGFSKAIITTGTGKQRYCGFAP